MTLPTSQTVQLGAKDTFYFHLDHMVYEYERARHGRLLEAVTSLDADAADPLPLGPCSKTSDITGDIHARVPHRVRLNDTRQHNEMICERTGDTDVPEGLDEETVEVHHRRHSITSSSGRDMTLMTVQPSEDIKDMFGKLASAHTGIIKASSAFEMLQETGSPADYKTLVHTLQHLELWRGRPTEVDRDGIPNVQINLVTFAKIMECEFPDLNAEARSCIEELRNAFEIASQRILSGDNSMTRQEWTVLLLDIVPIIIISLNALVIGYSADFHPESSVWVVCEALFTIVFTVEAVARFRISGCAKYFWGDEMGWNMFDVICLLCAYADILITAGYTAAGISYTDLDGVMLVKMLRLVRVCRILRTMRFGAVRELRVIIEGIFAGFNVLFWAITLLFFTVYVIGISARMVIEGVPEFSSVSASLTTTFRCFTDGCVSVDGASLVEGLRIKYGELGIVFALGYMVIFLFVVFGIFNLIMAVFLDKVLNEHVARELRDLGLRSQEMEDTIANVIGDLVSGKRAQLDESSRCSRWSSKCLTCCRRRRKNEKNDQVKRRLTKAVMVQLEGESSVSRDDFNAWLEYPEMIDLLRECKIELATKYELFDVLDADMGGCLQYGELVNGLMRLRGPITKTDVVSINLKVGRITQLIDDVHRKICGGDLSREVS